MMIELFVLLEASPMRICDRRPARTRLNACLRLTGLACLVLGCFSCQAAGKFTVEVGTGNLSFESITPNGTVEIVCGPQGGQHIWTSIRGQGNFDPSSVQIALNIRYANAPADGGSATICGQSLDSVTLSSNGAWQEFAGLRCFIPRPADVDGQRVILEGTMTDSTGASVSAQVPFTPTGPGRSCSLSSQPDAGSPSDAGGSADAGL
jgi:hypothetical protein